MKMWKSVMFLCGVTLDIASAVYTEYKDLDVSMFKDCCGDTGGCQPSGSPNYYRYFEPSIARPDILYVGAMNYLFALNTSTPALTCDKYQHLLPDQTAWDRCTRQGKADIPECQNHVREAFEVENQLEVCGTGGYAPSMYYLNMHDMTVNRTGDITVAATCPYDPFDNNTLLYSKYGNPGNSSAMYFGYYQDFIKNYPLFVRPRYSHNGITYVEKMTDPDDDTWLLSPQFVGSFDIDNSVMMFFREKAVEHQEATEKIYSRVGKVCKNDLGGGSAKKKWLSFQKARLICSLPGQQPYYFDDIYDVAYDGSKLFYALFYKPGADLNVSAICVYNISTIRAAFEGRFIFDNNQLVPEQDPRLDDCHLHDTNRGIFGDMSPRSHLMFQRVQPVSEKPIFYKRGEQLLRLTLGPQKGKFRNIYVGTSKGEIYDIFVNEVTMKTYHNVKLLPFEKTPQPTQPIWKLMLKDNYLILGSDYSVTKVPLDICGNIRDKTNISHPYNLDECLYNTRCKLAKCSDIKCVQADDNSCTDTLTMADVPSGQTVRQFLRSEFNYQVTPDTTPGFKGLFISLPVNYYPLRLDGVQWKKDGNILNDADRYAFSKNELVVKHLEYIDNGTYTAEDLEGAKVAEYNLIVYSQDDENVVKAWKQAFIDWSTAFNKWKDCTSTYLDSCAAVP